MERNIKNMPRPIPAHPTREEYLAERKLIRETCVSMLVFAVILTIPVFLVILVLWTEGFFTSFMSYIIALLILGIPALILLSTVMQTLLEERKRMQHLTQNYRNSAKHENEVTAV